MSSGDLDVDTAFENLCAMFELAHSRPRANDLEVFTWGAKNTDQDLKACGFVDRAHFQYWFDLTLAAAQGIFRHYGALRRAPYRQM